MKLRKLFTKLLESLVVSYSVLFIGIPILMIISFAVFGIIEYRNTLKLHNTLHPLSDETIVDLCEIFDLNPHDRRCNPQKEIYSYEFYGEINILFNKTPKIEGHAPPTFEEVESVLGSYNLGCKDVLEDGEFYFRYCWYDFSGIDEDPIKLFFDDSGNLDSLDIPRWD